MSNLNHPNVVFVGRKETKRGKVIEVVVIDKTPYFVILCEDCSFTSKPVDQCKLDEDDEPFAT